MNIADLSHLEILSEEPSVTGGMIGNGEASIDFSLLFNSQTSNRSFVVSRADIQGNIARVGGNGLALGDNTFTEGNLLAFATPGSSQSSGFFTAASN